MDDLDAHALCLGDGRERKDRGLLTRRLVLPAPHASLVVKIDPADPRGVSESGHEEGRRGSIGVGVCHTRILGRLGCVCHT